MRPLQRRVGAGQPHSPSIQGGGVRVLDRAGDVHEEREGGRHVSEMEMAAERLLVAEVCRRKLVENFHDLVVYSAVF